MLGTLWGVRDLEFLGTDGKELDGRTLVADLLREPFEVRGTYVEQYEPAPEGRRGGKGAAGFEPVPVRGEAASRTLMRDRR